MTFFAANSSGAATSASPTFEHKGSGGDSLPPQPGALKPGPLTPGALKPYSTLIALVILMVLFEIAGRLWNYDVKSMITGALFNGESFAFEDFVSALTRGLTSSEAAFFSPRNLTNLTLQVSLNGILAIGMTMVILTAGIDLGIGSVVALCGIALGIAQTKWGFPLLASIGCALAVGTSVGAVNGFLISKFNIPPFVVTLGFLVIARGLALIFSGSSAISPLSEEIRYLGGGFASPWVLIGLALFIAGFSFFLKNLASGSAKKQEATRSAGLLTQSSLPNIIVPGILFLSLSGLSLWTFFEDRGTPIPFLILAITAAIGIFVLGRTTFGRGLYALGGNETAALLSGIPVQRIKFLVYVIMGFLAGLAGIILAGRLNSATPTEGQLMELDAIAAVVIGGTSLQGGIGKIQGSIIGAFIIGVLNNGMDMLELSTDYQMVMKGLIIVFAVWSDSKAKKKS